MKVPNKMVNTHVCKMNHKQIFIQRQTLLSKLSIRKALLETEQNTSTEDENRKKLENWSKWE